MDPGWVVAAGVLGLAVGSFLNVVIVREPQKKSVVSPASACPACETPIAPRDNVPLVSYVVLRGRCRHCGVRIPARYPLVEALTAALFAASASRFAGPADAALAAGAFAVLVAIAFIDLDHRRVPNVIVLPATAVAAAFVVAAGAATGRLGSSAAALGSGAAGFLLLLVVALAVPGGMGFGDVKLMAFIGTVTGWYGWEVFVLSLFAGFTVGGVTGVVVLALRRGSRKSTIPFAPSLAAGAALAVLAGPGPVRAWLGV